jgi:hypothetical protein
LKCSKFGFIYRPVSLLASMIMALFWVCHGTGNEAHAVTTAELDLTVNPSGGVLRGVVKLRIENSSSMSLKTTDLWLFPERLTVRPKGLTEVEEEWMFPGRFSAGGLKLLSVHDARGRKLEITYPSPTLARVTLKESHTPETIVNLVVHFETKVPHRYGPFGQVGGQMTLDGGFFPRPPPMGTDGYRPDAPPGLIRYALRLRGSGQDMHALTLGTLKKVGPEATWSFRETHAVERVCLILLKSFYVTRLNESGVDILFLHRDERSRDTSEGSIPDLMAIDTQGQTVATVGMVLPYLREKAGIVLPDRLVLVEAPLRRDLAIEAPGMILISDRAFDLPGMERFLRLHRTALLRAVVGSVLRPSMRKSQPNEWRDRAVDLGALELVARWEAHRYGSSYDLSRALSAGSFVAQVDEVLYAPQIPLQHVFFRPVDDTDRYRDRFSLFSHSFPNGHRLHVKLQDRSTSGEVGALVDDMLLGKSLKESYLERFSDPSGRLLKQWNQGYPKLNYRLMSSRQGVDNKGHFVDVVFQQEGDTSIVEPVRVGVWDEDGQPAYGRWDGEGQVGKVRIRTKAATKRVQLDPNHRLLEFAVDNAMKPRSDNQDYDPWKFLIRGLTLGFASAGQHLNIGLVTSVKPTFSTRHTVFIEPYDSGFGTGLLTSYFYHFGQLVRPNLRRYHLGFYGTGEWQRESSLWKSGFRGSAGVGVGGSTYLSRVNPTSGSRWSVGASLQGALRHSESTLAFRLSGSLAHVLSLDEGHVLAFRLHLASALGDTTESNRWRLGGAGRVRSFGLLSATGDHRVLSSVEWRHRWGRGLNINIAQLAWVKSIQGVLFVDAALLANEVDALVRPSSLFVGAGYGLRIIYHVLGVYPTVFGIDFSVPLFTGRELTSKAELPFSVLATAGQTF